MNKKIFSLFKKIECQHLSSTGRNEKIDTSEMLSATTQ
ncbi:hypothetical protein C943_03678 [Mariniradius saccharolyticus AK6]|uniref:Uncharacterized protein n=1 Tax=Mariniradius saccharolyticus AK6 TaxID=1239962 RepID=M7XI10_9BACT|nr:hypothetical protein C943_03678 [Mariniradius saccharolyticus AK6]